MSEFEIKKVPKQDKQQECAGCCGEVFPASELTTYKKKLYCKECLAIKQIEVKKPAGLTEDAIKQIVSNQMSEITSLTGVAVEQLVDTRITPLLKEITALKQKIAESPNYQLRDLVIAAKTIMGHFVGSDGKPGLARFTSMRQNGRQGNDMRAWLAQAEKVLEGK